MKYLKMFKVMPEDILGNAGKGVDWEFFGFEPSALRRLTVHGDIAKDTYVMCLPISNEELLNSKMQLLQDRVNATPVEEDSIEIITEADKELIKQQIAAYRATLVQ